jgi:hypothetical protein
VNDFIAETFERAPHSEKVKENFSVQKNTLAIQPINRFTKYK